MISSGNLRPSAKSADKNSSICGVRFQDNFANNSPITANNRCQLGPVGLCWRELPIRWQVLHNPFSAWNELGRNVERAIAKIFTNLR